MEARASKHNTSASPTIFFFWPPRLCLQTVGHVIVSCFHCICHLLAQFLSVQRKTLPDQHCDNKISKGRKNTNFITESLL